MKVRQLKQTLLSIARSLGGFRLARHLTRKQLRILCYHGFAVSDEYRALPDMFMREETFRRRMELLARLRIPVLPLDEAVRRLTQGQIENADTVVTLDDGWVTNLTIALPILKRHAFPATIYVTTEHLVNGTEVFNMVLAYLFRTTTQDTLHLAGINPELDGTYALRPDYSAVNEALVQAAERSLSLRERQALLARIAAAFGVDITSILSGDRFRLLTADQIAELDRNGISIELHSHTHKLPANSFDATRDEITRNRDALHSITGKVASHFCYPSGNYGPSHPEWLASLGLKSATTCDPGINDTKANPFLLKRFLDQDDISDIEFEAYVTGFEHLFRRLVK